MSLKTKTLGILLTVMVLFIVSQGLIHRYVILPGFLSLEQAEADKNIQRCVQAIDRELFHLSSLVHDWSAWDDTYDFMLTRSETFAKVNLLPDETFEMNHIHLLYICGPDGQVIWSKSIDPSTGEPLSDQDIPGRSFIEDQAGFKESPENPDLSELDKTGVMKTPLGPLLISARPVLTSENHGPSRGTLIMGRFLAGDAVKNIAKQTEVHFEMIPLETGAGADDTPGLRDVIEGRSQAYTDSSDERNLMSYTVLNDIMAHPVYLVKTVMPRTILRKGLETMGFSMVSIMVSGCILIFLILIILHVTILGPISQLSSHVRSVEESGNLLHRLNISRHDEIGALARRFDIMLEKLSDMRSELLERSYYAGLAGMTSDILHHGRNILMPMAHSLDRLKEICRGLPRESIHKAIDELDAGPLDPEREKNLNRFLRLSAGEFLKTLETAVCLLDESAGQSKDMERLFMDLEQYSRKGIPAAWDIDPEEVVRKALSQLPVERQELCLARLGAGLSGLPRIKTEPLVLTHVLTSVLYYAAAFALQRSEGQAEILIDARTEGTHDDPRIRFVVSGNGPVMDAAHLRTVFLRDYTDNGTGPLCSSLHWCSNVISAMGGSLELVTIDHGSAFHLVLPTGGTNEQG